MSALFDGLPTIFVDTFGESEPVTIVAPGGTRTSITAILRVEDGAADVFGDRNTVRVEKTLHARTVDVAAVRKDDLIVANGTEYHAGTPMDDREGMTKIPLWPI